MFRTFFIWGSISAFLSVVLGAFGAHALDLPERYAATYQTGVEYHMAHSLALLLTAFASERLGSPNRVRWAGRLFLAGIVLFSGNLYVLSVTGLSWLGAVVPLGGASFLAGWLLLAAAAWGSSGRK